jgi:hypothetical protein
MSDIKKQLLGGAAAPFNPVMQDPNVKVVQSTTPPPGKAQIGPRVLVSLPSGRTWESRTATAVAGLCTFSALHGVQISIANLEGSMISKQRNDLVKMAIENNFDYMMWVDTDMIMPPNALLRLLGHNKDVVGATYNKRVPPYETLGKLKGPQPADLLQGGLFEADLMPGGFMLVKTEVYKKMGWPYYWETYQWSGNDGVESLKTYLRDNYFELPPEEVLASLDAAAPLGEWLNKMATTYGHRWEYYSEDLNFCRKLRKAGTTIWCDLTLTFEMIHLGTLEVTCRPPAKQNAVADAVVPAVM